MNKEKLYEFTNMFLAEQRYKKFLYKAKNKYGDRYDYVVIHIPVITVEQLINFIQIIKTQLSKHIRYKDGKLVFKTFKEFANYKKLPPEAKMRDYDSYLFNPI